MYLTLEVVSPQAASLGARRRQIVGTKGLTIGRAPGNDWVIPDPYVSKQHARIVCSEGRFFVEGLGRNPIAVGRADNAIPASQLQALENGDRLFIDQYEILVAALPGDPPGEALVSGGVEAEPDAGPVDSVSATPTPAASASFEAARIPDVWDKGMVDVSSETAELDPLHALGDRGSVAAGAAPPVNWQQSSPLDEHFKPPAPRRRAGEFRTIGPVPSWCHDPRLCGRKLRPRRPRCHRPHQCNRLLPRPLQRRRPLYGRSRRQALTSSPGYAQPACPIVIFRPRLRRNSGKCCASWSTV